MGSSVPFERQRTKQLMGTAVSLFSVMVSVSVLISADGYKAIFALFFALGRACVTEPSRLVFKFQI